MTDEMIPLLLLTRAAIIGWTTMAVVPLEITFDLIEGELERLGGAVNINRRDTPLAPKRIQAAEPARPE
jgi:hypothetical protein